MAKHVFFKIKTLVNFDALAIVGWVAFVSGIVFEPLWLKLTMLSAARVLPQGLPFPTTSKVRESFPKSGNLTPTLYFRSGLPPASEAWPAGVGPSPVSRHPYLVTPTGASSPVALAGVWRDTSRKVSLILP